VQQPASNQRWRSDIFLIPCRSGEVLSVAFAIDCHDREVFAWTASPRALNGGDIRTLMDKALWARVGEATTTAPHAIQWRSDNGPQYTATASVLYAHELGLVPISTPAYSPESNGLAQGFVHTFKRDYVNVHELRDAESVLAQLGGWFDDLQLPGSAFGAWDAERDGVSRSGVSKQRIHAPSVYRLGEQITEKTVPSAALSTGGGGSYEPSARSVTATLTPRSRRTNPIFLGVRPRRQDPGPPGSTLRGERYRIRVNASCARPAGSSEHTASSRGLEPSPPPEAASVEILTNHMPTSREPGGRRRRSYVGKGRGACSAIGASRSL